jgi:two-component system LytT family response regulator
MRPATARIRALVADDEPLARRGVRQLLSRHPDIIVVGESRNGPETLKALEALTPDLLFLDIQMPEMDGFEILRAHGPARMPAIIFVTAHDHFAVQAFDAQALDYLVKPLNIERFDAALNRVRQRIQMIEDSARAAQLAALLAAERAHRERSGIERIMIPTSAGELIIAVAEIDWIGADDYYSCLHVGSKDHIIRESLNSLEARLNPNEFVRVHRSAIVQLARIRELRGEELILHTGQRIPVSRRKRPALEHQLR